MHSILRWLRSGSLPDRPSYNLPWTVFVNRNKEWKLIGWTHGIHKLIVLQVQNSIRIVNSSDFQNSFGNVHRMRIPEVQIGEGKENGNVNEEKIEIFSCDDRE